MMNARHIKVGLTASILALSSVSGSFGQIPSGAGARAGGAEGAAYQSASLSGQSANKKRLMVNEGDRIEIPLSVAHPTRVSFLYDAGSQMIFNQAETGSAEIQSTVDKRGDVYLTVASGRVGQTLSGFLVTEGNRTYSMDLVIGDNQPRHVEIVSLEAMTLSLEAERKAKEAASQSEINAVEWSNRSNYHDSIARLMKALYLGADPKGFETGKKRSREETREGFTRTVSRRLVAENAEAIVYELTNTNAFQYNPESHLEWFEPYVAVAFGSDMMVSGAQTDVYVLRSTVDAPKVRSAKSGRSPIVMPKSQAPASVLQRQAD